MSSVAKLVRQRTIESVRAMSTEERIDLAFALGEHDLALYMNARASERVPAIAVFRANRQIGRRPSTAASGRRA